MGWWGKDLQWFALTPSAAPAVTCGLSSRHWGGRPQERQRWGCFPRRGHQAVTTLQGETGNSCQGECALGSDAEIFPPP